TLRKLRASECERVWASIGRQSRDQVSSSTYAELHDGAGQAIVPGSTIIHSDQRHQVAMAVSGLSAASQTPIEPEANSAIQWVRFGLASWPPCSCPRSGSSGVVKNLPRLRP